MHVFLLCLAFFSCFASNESEWGVWRAWSRVQSCASRLAGNVSDCIRDEDTVLGPVYFVVRRSNAVKAVREAVKVWWQKEDAILGPVYCVVGRSNAVKAVREEAKVWWQKEGAVEKVTDVMAAATLVSGTVFLGTSVPALYAGTWSIFPRCLFTGPVYCTSFEFGLYLFKAGSIFSVLGCTLIYIVIDGSRMVNSVADSVADSVLEMHRVYGD